MSTIQILLHILPREIDELERICDHLHRSSFFLSPDDKVNLDITLNLSNEFTDWDKSLLPKEFFIEKFKSIEIKSDWTNKNIFELNYDKTCMGCNDKRRNSIRKYSDSVSHFLYLDPDVSFPIWGLYYMFRAIESINSKYYMITGETQRLWDESWDCIVNKRYLNTPIGPEDFSKLNLRAYKKFDPYKIDKEFFDNIGDTKIDFSVQSCCKPVNYGLALEDLDEEYVHTYVGREPSGQSFNELLLNKLMSFYNKNDNLNKMLNITLVIPIVVLQ